MSKLQFKQAAEMRGVSFGRNLDIFMKMSKLKPNLDENETSYKYTLAVLHLGAPACGVNSCTRSFVRQGVSRKCRILGVQDGFEGLVRDDFKELDWSSVYGWTSVGGSLLGCQRVEAKQVGLEKLAKKIKQHKIQGLLLIGGFEAFTSLLQLSESREQYPEFCIPIACCPATISNNVPGTEFSIGCDTALNELVSVCDKLKQSALGSKRRVFLVETMGGYCGYLASMTVCLFFLSLWCLTIQLTKLRIKR
jgi:6-phosphofructokinase 1